MIKELCKKCGVLEDEDEYEDEDEDEVFSARILLRDIDQNDFDAVCRALDSMGIDYEEL